MNERTASKVCPRCGAVLPAEDTAGLCPKCLLAEAMAGTQTESGPASTRQPLSPAELAPRFPQLEILEFLGRGGMGVVYKARQKSLNRIVALKLLAPERVDDPKFAARFTREAHALAALNHPNIVTVYDFGQAGGFYYLLMEFVDGANLRQLLRARRFTPEEALAIVPPLCDALQYAHERGIVHRDIKPANILLDKQGRVKVADFGIAKMLVDSNGSNGGPAAADTGENATHAAAGTPAYCAPEQKTDAARADSRADIYSLGVVLYEMLTGELPGSQLSRPSAKVHIDVRLDQIVLRALEQNPELRYQQASELKTMVETVLQTGVPSPPPSTTWPPRGFEYRSKATLFGLPLVHVCGGDDPQTGRVKTAKGILAIGGRAVGVVAIGGLAVGGLACGGAAVGVLAFGGAAFGLIALGGLAVALFLAVGGGAIAPIALGGGAIGYYALGGKGLGVHVLAPGIRDQAARQFFLPWATTLVENSTWIFLALAALTVIISLCLPLAINLRIKLRTQLSSGSAPGNTTSLSSPGLAFWLAALIGVVTVIVLAALHAIRPVPGPMINRSAVVAPHRGDFDVYIESLGTAEKSNTAAFSIPEEDAQEVVKKFDARQPLRVQAFNRDFRAKIAHGDISGVNNQIDTATGTLTCHARLTPENGTLLIPGLFMNIRLLLDVKHDVLLVPASIVQYNSTGAFVWVIAPDNKNYRKEVTVIGTHGDETAIGAGLSATDLLVQPAVSGR